jgi:hypothetical protein
MNTAASSKLSDLGELSLLHVFGGEPFPSTNHSCSEARWHYRSRSRAVLKAVSSATATIPLTAPPLQHRSPRFVRDGAELGH